MQSYFEFLQRQAFLKREREAGVHYRAYYRARQERTKQTETPKATSDSPRLEIYMKLVGLGSLDMDSKANVKKTIRKAQSRYHPDKGARDSILFNEVQKAKQFFKENGYLK